MSSVGVLVPVHSSVDDQTAARPGRRITSRDLAWLTWRQHRAILVIGACVAVGGSVLLVVLRMVWAHYGTCGVSRLQIYHGSYPRSASACVTHENGIRTWIDDVLRAMPWLPVGIALFWGAPLLSREFETGTAALAFGQDLRPRRWLAGKLIYLAASVLVLSAAVSLCAEYVMSEIDRQWVFPVYEQKYFEASLLPFLGYAVLALALGAAAGILMRRTVPAMALAGVAFIGFREVLRHTRFHYLPARTVSKGLIHGYFWPVGNGLFVREATVNSHGNPVTVGPGRAALRGNAVTACMKAKFGAVAQAISYQPAGRVLVFEVIEAAICLIAAVLLIALSFWLLRRRVHTA